MKCAIFMYTDLTNRNDMTLNEQYELLGAFCTEHNYQVESFTVDVKYEENRPLDLMGLDVLLNQMDENGCKALLIAHPSRINEDMNLKYNVKIRLFEMNAHLISVC